MYRILRYGMYQVDTYIYMCLCMMSMCIHLSASASPWGRHLPEESLAPATIWSSFHPQEGSGKDGGINGRSLTIAIENSRNLP